jgi:predicted PurR-regulated permease PerM
MDRKNTETWFFKVLVVVLAAVIIAMVFPYLSMIVLAAVMAFVFSGVFRWLSRILRNRTLAALVTTTLVLVTILIPLSLVGYRIAQEAGGLYTSLRNQASGQHISALLVKVQNSTRSYLPAASLDARAVSDRLQQLLGWVVGHLGTVFSGITQIVLNFFFFLLFFYYLVKDGQGLSKRAVALSPLSSVHERQIMDRIASAVSGTIRGQLVLSILQGIVAGFGFAFFGVPNPALWGSLIVFSSFIPVVGTWLVVVPCILYLSVTAPIASVIGLTVWAITAIALIDNVLAPKVLSRGTHLHPLITMVAVLGGIQMFGPVGILIGPLLVSVFFSLTLILLSLRSA